MAARRSRERTGLDDGLNKRRACPRRQSEDEVDYKSNLAADGKTTIAHLFFLSLFPPPPNSYNLKRKVAGLPPVTREWYEARAAALKASLASGGGGGGGAAGASASSSSAVSAGAARSWLDPLTRKKFTSEATYRTFVSSNKYRELVKRSGQPAPEAVVVVHSLEGGGSEAGGNGGNGGGGATTRSQAAAARKKQQQGAAGTAATTARDVLPAMATPTTSAAATAAAFRVAAPNGVTFAAGNDMEAEGDEDDDEKADAEDDNSSGWETASDNEDEIEPWDPTVSLFDNKKFDSVEACLEHMWRKFSFYIPDVAHCSDPGGFLSYLGAKLRSGLVPLYTRGDDEGGKTFHSLHAVQRHMIDLGNCRVCWEGNEDEYAEWYQWSDDDGDDDEMDYSDDDDGDDDEIDYSDDDGDDDDIAASAGNSNAAEEAFELALPNGKVIGARAFAKFYKQSHRPFARSAAAAAGGGGGGGARRALAGAGAAARAANLGSGIIGGAGNSLALTAAAREQQRSAVVARYRAMGVKEADVPAAARKERKARNAQQRGRARETLRSALAANVNRNLPKNVPY